MAKRPWSGRTSGANIHNIRVYICAECGGWNNAKKPGQCDQCGCIEFIHFHSKAEAKRYGELKLEAHHGFITDLKLQPKFELHAVGTIMMGEHAGTKRTKIGSYFGDFSYTRNGKHIVEDVKGGADTSLSAWKRKHTEAEYGVQIQVVIR